jgi:uncharacterized membrane protein
MNPTHPQKTPWFVRLMIGVGVTIAALLFLGVLAILELLQEDTSRQAIGILLVVAAVVMKQVLSDKAPLFLEHLNLAAVLVGQLLLAASFIEHEITAVAVALLGVEIFLLWLYPDSVQRFLSGLAIGILTAIYFYNIDTLRPMDTAALVVAVLITFLWLLPWPTVEPLRAAAIPGLGMALSVLLLPTAFGEISQWATGQLVMLGLAVVVLGSAIYVIAELRAGQLFLPVFVALAGVLFLTREMPGLASSLFLMVVAFHRRSKALLGMAIAFLALFLGSFYYQLDMTLLQKSGILVLSGAVLLGLRFLLSKAPAAQPPILQPKEI